MKLTFLFSFILSASFVFSKDPPKKEQTEDTEVAETINVESDDPEMNATIKTAQDTFISQFLKMTKDEKLKEDISMAMLKVKFLIPEDEKEKVKDNANAEKNTKKTDEDKDTEEFAAEHMWVTGISFDDKLITGTLVSEALDKRLPKINSIVTFKVDKISDWLVVKNGIAEGGFSVQLLRSRMTPKERAKHDALYPFLFEKKKAPIKKEESPK